MTSLNTLVPKRYSRVLVVKRLCFALDWQKSCCERNQSDRGRARSALPFARARRALACE